MVVDKRAGWLVQRTASKKHQDVLIDALHQRYGFVHPVHRLDRFVSGVLVYGRDEDARDALRAQFRDHSADRRYLAAVRGLVEEDEGTVRSRLAMDPHTFSMKSVEGADARTAITHWWVVERFSKAAASMLEVALETGVKNQIRVHLADLGHPILGEQKYLEAKEERRTTQRRRLFLHAGFLSFRHPETGRIAEYEAPLPSDLGRWRAQLRRGDPKSKPRRR